MATTLRNVLEGGGTSVTIAHGTHTVAWRISDVTDQTVHWWLFDSEDREIACGVESLLPGAIAVTAAAEALGDCP